jgi:hypothetical protein
VSAFRTVALLVRLTGIKRFGRFWVCGIVGSLNRCTRPYRTCIRGVHALMCRHWVGWLELMLCRHWAPCEEHPTLACTLLVTVHASRVGTNLRHDGPNSNAVVVHPNICKDIFGIQHSILVLAFCRGWYYINLCATMVRLVVPRRSWGIYGRFSSEPCSRVMQQSRTARRLRQVI